MFYFAKERPSDGTHVFILKEHRRVQVIACALMVAGHAMAILGTVRGWMPLTLVGACTAIVFGVVLVMFSFFHFFFYEAPPRTPAATPTAAGAPPTGTSGPSAASPATGPVPPPPA